MLMIPYRMRTGRGQICQFVAACGPFVAGGEIRGFGLGSAANIRRQEVSTTETPARTGGEVETEVRNRRTFAIISHPDAGKTTLTENLLLKGGAIRLAGQVKA